MDTIDNLPPIEIERRADRAPDPLDRLYLRGVADGAAGETPETPRSLMWQVCELGLRLSDVPLARRLYAQGFEIGGLIRARRVG